MNLSLVNWTNESINLTSKFINDLASGTLRCPFEPTFSPDYNILIIFNFVASLLLFLEMRYEFQTKIGMSKARAVRNSKLLILMAAVFNTIWVLNQFLLLPLFQYLRVVYGL